MSHSVFKEFPGTTTTTTTARASRGGFSGIAGGASPAAAAAASSPVSSDGRQDNVVIVLNKDGSVSVDQHALHTFLRDDTGKTAVSVVRVQSPTPSLQEELREQGPSSDEEDSNSANEQQPENSDATDANESNDSDEEDDSEDGDDNSDSDAAGAGEQEDEELEDSEASEDLYTNRSRRRTAKGTATKAQATNNNNNKGGGAGKRKKNRKTQQKDRPPHLRLTVEQYLAPEQAKLFAAEILQYAGMSSGLSLDVDYDYQRFVVQNDHCYTPLTSPKQKGSTGGAAAGSSQSQQPENNKKAPTSRDRANNSRKRPADSKANASSSSSTITATTTSTPQVVTTTRRGRQIVKPVSKVIEIDSGDDDLEAEDLDSEEQGGEEEEQQTDDEDYSVSESENDRDSDLDFRVNSNYLPKRKKHQKQPQLANQSQQSATTAGSKQNTPAIANSQTKANQFQGSAGGINQRQGGSAGNKPPHHPVGSTSGGPSTSSSTTTVRVKPRSSLESRILHQTKLSFNKSPKVTTSPAHHHHHHKPQHRQGVIPQKQQRAAQPPVVVVPTAQVTTPTSTLASRREKERQEKAASAAAAAAALKQDPLFTDMSSLFATPDIIKKVGSGTSNNKQREEPTAINQQQQLHQNIIQLPRAFELDLISSIVDDTDDPMETRKGAAAAAAAAAVDKNNVTDDGLDLNDTSLLDGIVGDDGLPEELLQHVAELVENKSLQEVIDKQVLGVEDPMAHLTNLLPKQQSLSMPTQMTVIAQHPTTPIQQPQPQVKRESPFVKLAQQKQLAKQSAAAAASLTAPRKEPIKIVRSDGRVITLPPIEAPTTRGAKRRAQNNSESSTSATSTPVVVTVSMSPAPVSTPVTPQRVTPTTPQRITPTTPQRMTPVRKDSEDSQMVEILSAHLLPEIGAPVSGRKKSGSERGSERGSTSRRASTTPSVAESDMDMEFNSEDDPDRLWCICKQPHNNRFMICCDTCEDWFHGKCVNITKAMGQQMEAAGKEWTCPNCKQGLSGSEQVCLVCHKKAKPDSVYCSDECIVKHAQKTQQGQSQQQGGGGGIQIIMTKPATSGQGQVGGVAGSPRIIKPEGGTPEAPRVRIGLLKNAQGRVIVFHKKTKQCLSGDNAPFLANIKEWLALNPDYAIVAPGSEVAEAFKAKQAQLQQLKVKAQAMQQKPIVGSGGDSPGGGDKASIQAKLKFGMNKQMVIVHPKTAQQIKVAPTGKSSPTTADKTTPLKAPRKTAPEGQGTPTLPMDQRKIQRGEVEPIRLTVRKTLKEQLAQRMMEVKEGGAKLTAEEIEQFALETEQEMFAVFNRDTGQKYKAKYRSLIFNIKDRKNETLFKKICEKGVKPYRLVRLSPEDLASQELAKWRENENKHQLEMIKKSEMDLLACAKNYVLKSHKGEEVMENIRGENATMSSAVDDVTMLSGMTTMEGDDQGQDDDDEASQGSQEAVRSRKDGGGERKRERSRERDRDKHRSHHSSSSSSKHHHHSSSSSSGHKRKRSRERSRERDKEREKDKLKGTTSSGSGGGSSKHKSTSSSSSSRDHHHKDKEKSSSSGNKKESSSTSSSSRHHHHKDHKVHASIKEESNHSSSPASTSSNHHKSSSSGGEQAVFKPSKKETEESYDLIEKILQETSPELVAKLHEMEKQKTIEAAGGSNNDASDDKKQNQQTVKSENPAEDEEYNPESAAMGDEGEDSPPLAQQHPKGLWSGRVVYQEIAAFQGVLLPLYGETADVLPDLPTSFEVQGRIGPEVVWDYLGKIKRSVNRDITVVRFVPRSSKEHAAYETMYSYFETKGRLGVLKPKSEVIKDFYLVPQKKGRLLPSVLLTLKGLGNYETKANCIVGIVVRATLKRPSSSAGGGVSGSAPPAKMVKKTPVAAVVREEVQQYTPPGSPKVTSSSAHKLLSGLPNVGGGGGELAKKTDDDEPYSPGGSDEDDVALDTIPVSSTTTAAAPGMPSELQKEVERLNRQIEAQKNEIVEMLSKDPLEEEPYSPSRPVSPSKDKVSSSMPLAMSNISIPSNLQEILASLKNVNTTQQRPMQQQQEEEDDDDEYNPLPISASTTISTEAYKPRPQSPSTRAYLLAQEQNAEEIPFLGGGMDNDEMDTSGPSKLSHMTDAELMALVPDGVDLPPPPPPKIVSSLSGLSGMGGGIPGLGDGNDEEYDPGQ